MKIAIYNHGIPFDGNTPFGKPLGGSESSIIYMGRELGRLGHAVTVYANCSGGEFVGVKYRNYHEFFNDYVSLPWDVLISFRSFDPFLLGRVAPRTIYWTGDAVDQPALNDFGHETLQRNIDLVFCVSDWHRCTMIEKFHLPQNKVVATRNGFCPELVEAANNRHSDDRACANAGTTQPQFRQWTRCAYTSTPFRGLDILLKLFPEIWRRVPGLSLDVFSSMQVYGWSSDEDRRVFGSLYGGTKQYAVTWHGSVPQPVLLTHLSKTGLFLYPNTFDETSCIAAIEAQASGCVVVTSAKAALQETVEHGRTGICIHGDPRGAEYQREFIETVCALSANPARLQELSMEAARRAFRHYTWESIAAEWTHIFECMPPQQVHTRWSGPLMLLHKTHEYVRKGNISAARRVLSAMEETPFLRNEVEALKGTLSTWM